MNKQTDAEVRANLLYSIIAINETEYLNESLAALAGQFYCLYATINQRVHLCELTPSYYLVPIGYTSANLLDDAADEEAREAVGYEAIYVHVNKCLALPHVWTNYECDEDIDMSTDRGVIEALDEFAEKFNANPYYDYSDIELFYAKQ